ncbi:hypothetical protein GCM10020367_67030 [Streptomyces sannanensis]|uniref:Uncharacterized protein n=1 Tax=Streptomyces sannanensis TaxID=285536 RepID=A0ABP6S3M2_9ACTN
MPAAIRCLLLLTVLLAGGASVAAPDGGPGTAAGQHRGGTGTPIPVAGSLLDTSWGDGYTPPQM